VAKKYLEYIYKENASTRDSMVLCLVGNKFDLLLQMDKRDIPQSVSLSSLPTLPPLLFRTIKKIALH